MGLTGREAVRKLSVTISSATGTGTIAQKWDIARRIRCIPVAETDVYTFQISDADGDIILKRESQTGTLSENVDLSLGIATTVTISAATQDGTYTVKFDMH